MDLTESVVQGGVLIVHKLHEGKHQYEVENVVKYKKTSGEKAFARKGDKLMQINDIDLQDLTPEELTQMLAEGCPKLTVHNSSEVKNPRIPSVQALAGDDTFYPVSKESMMLTFTMEMRREDDWEGSGEEQGEGSGEGTKPEEDFCETEKNLEGGDLLIVSMQTTRISVLKGRGGEDGSPCQDCTVNNVIVVAKSSTVTLVSRGSESLRMEKSLNRAIQHVFSHYYLRGLCSQRVIYASPNPERITIYYYKSNPVDMVSRGIPVVLNFTDSNCFLRCCREGEKVVLKIDTCDKERLKQISTGDKGTLSFVFYMRSDRTMQQKFESALHLGWFIQIIDTSGGSELVEMATLDAKMEEKSFLFIIQK